MRRVLPIALLLGATLCVGEAQAQWRKSWDFTQGYCETTKTNLNLDTDNWAPNRYAEDGSTTGWKDVSNNCHGELQANGEPIEELRGLTFGTAGLSSNGTNFLLDPTSIRMSRNNMEVTFPKLIGGQTITAVAKSANSTATNRGIVSATDELIYVSGPEDGLCLGSGVDGAPADGLYTLVWQVRDDVTDSISVTLKIVGGGVDIKSFTIDQGEGGDSGASIAFIYDSAHPSYTPDNLAYGVLADLLPQQLACHITLLDTSDESVRTSVTADSLQGYDVVVVSPYVGADNAYLSTIKEAIAFTPILNLSPEAYATWGYGTAVSTSTNMLTVNGRAVNSPLFKPIDSTAEPYIDANGQLMFLDESSTIMGYNATAGGYFANDSILAYADGTPAIHVHNITRNAYMLLPYTAEAVMAESAADILPNAVVMLYNTKRTVGATGAPLVTQEYHHLYTTVTLTTTTPNSAIYYTLDGSQPTTESTLYTGPFDISEQGITVKAVALGDGFLLSDMGEQTIDIYELASAPTIAYTEASGVSTVTITPANEGDVIYYNLIGSSSTTSSSIYTEPLQLTKHATVTAFAAANDSLDLLQSELVELVVTVRDEQVRLDNIAHFDANGGEWNANSVGSSYYGFRGGYPYYTEEIASTEVYEDWYGEGQDSIVNHYVPANTVTYYAPGNGWRLASYGQQMLWQNNGASHNVADFNAYNPETALDDDSEITSGCVQLSAVSQTNLDGVRDPASASLQTTDAYQGPFDVVGYVSGHGAVVYVEVSTDTLNADGWQRLGQLNGGTIEGLADNGRNGSDRIWRKTIVPYNGNDNVYVRLMTDGGMANIFNVFLKNEGELSQAYITGITDLTTDEACGQVVGTMVYGINGARLAAPAKGINIVKTIYSNGVVKTRKVMVK